MRGMVAFLTLLTIGFAGCTGGFAPAVVVGSNGQFNPGVLEDSTGACGETARIDAGTNGQGHLVITVWDGAGVQKATLTHNGNSQQGMDKELSGEPGDWRLKVEAKRWNSPYNTGSYGGFELGFNGQYGATLSY